MSANNDGNDEIKFFSITLECYFELLIFLGSA